MITEVKDVLEGVLIKAGVPKAKIARNARDEQSLSTQRQAYPVASLVSDPGRFGNPEDSGEVRVELKGQVLYRQMRTRRTMPVVVKITGETELQAGDLLSRVIAALPSEWEYDGVKGDLEPVSEEYSDYDSRIHARYEAVVVVEFSVDVGPRGTAAYPVRGIDSGDGEYESRQVKAG